ncbi:hypothetical protein VKT23_019752 [Stygiomarasmius scandens]|uniref:Uncharacterized protein n=1 Tax=Marasmiellus scandens TaxID=2682957 RepID=A0ABR1IPL9_9AGAR
MEEIGMPGIMAFVGPNPLSMGDIDLYLTSVGTTPSGLSWPQYDPEAYKVFRRSMIAFAKNIFPHKVRAARSLQQQPSGPLVKVWGSGDASAINDDETDSEPEEEQQSRQKPGPGRNSSSLKERGGKKSKRSGKDVEESSGKKRKRSGEDVEVNSGKKRKGSGEDTEETSGKKQKKSGKGAEEKIGKQAKKDPSKADPPKKKSSVKTAKSKATVSSDNESSDDVPLRSLVKETTTSKKAATSAKAASPSTKPTPSSSTKRKAPSPKKPTPTGKKSVTVEKPAAPAPTQAATKPRPKPKPITRNLKTSKTPTTAAQADIPRTASTLNSDTEIIPSTPDDIISPAASENDTPGDDTSAAATGIAIPGPPASDQETSGKSDEPSSSATATKPDNASPTTSDKETLGKVDEPSSSVTAAKPDNALAGPAGIAIHPAPVDTHAAEVSFMKPFQPAINSRTAEAEAWNLVHLYACNPDGNMAQLHTKLKSILGDAYNAANWNSAVQSATDEDGDLQQAAAKVRSMAPSFVFFCERNNNDEDSEEDEDNAQQDNEEQDEDNEDNEEQDEDDNEEQDEDGNDELAYDETQEISVWNHPGCMFWRPWIKDSVRRWKEALQERDIDMAENWVSTFEEMMDSWLRLEEVREYQEYAGKIESSKEPDWIEEWRADEVRYAVWPGKWSWDELKEELQAIEQWWKDVRPERDLEKEKQRKGKKKQEEQEELDWAPLDRTSGLDGFWMFLVTMISVMLHRHNDEGPMFEMFAWQADWQLLAEDMVQVMKQVVEDGVEALPTETVAVELPKRTTRGQKRMLEEQEKDKKKDEDEMDEPKAKKARGNKTGAKTEAPAMRETRSKAAAIAMATERGKPRGRRR